MGSQRVPTSAGLTLMELVIAIAVLSLLASVAMPLAEVTVTRTKEIELRRALREIRGAIDAYKDDYDRAVNEKKIIDVVGKSGYPEDLAVLVNGTEWGGLYPYKKKYLRRLPRDPFDRNNIGWGLRSYADAPDSQIWGGKNVYDIYSQHHGTALDGSFYRDW